MESAANRGIPTLTNQLLTDIKNLLGQEIVLMVTPGSLPYGADRLTQTNADVNGNYQTVTYYKSGSVVKIVTLTFDANGNVIDGSGF